MFITKIFKAFAFGGLLGALGGVLFAPAKGGETRSIIKRFLDKPKGNDEVKNVQK